MLINNHVITRIQKQITAVMLAISKHESKAVAEADQQDWSSDEEKEEWIKQRKKELGETEHYCQAVYMTIEDSIDAVRKYAFSYKKNLKKEGLE